MFKEDQLVEIYKEKLKLQKAIFSLIDHDDAMVAIVYRVSEPNGEESILKVCTRENDYLREVYFLKHLAQVLPVPHIKQLLPPSDEAPAAILMQYLPGELLKNTDLTDEIAYEIGALLARLHLNRASGYGDPAQQKTLSSDPRKHFTEKFEEGLAECGQLLPKNLLEPCHRYYETHIQHLNSIDGPCFIHRDFRPGNMIIDQGKIQGIIDWAGARASFAEEDFIPFEHGEWSLSPTQKKSFLTGYASIRTVPKYHDIMPLLRLSRATATAGFLIKRGTWDNRQAKLYQKNLKYLERFQTATEICDSLE